MNDKILSSIENITEKAVEGVFELITQYIEQTPNKIDDVVLAFLPKAKEYVLKQVDKIDGKENV
jgi:hypothetical protein